jgi:hypothetical protein
MEPEQNQPIEEEQQEQKEQPVQSTPFQSQESQSDVSFPTVGGEKKSGGAKTLLIVGILVLVAILGFVIYKSASKKSAGTSTEASPFDNLTTPSSDQTVQTVAPSSSPAATIDKTKIQIQVQNGTGIAGEAAYLQTQLGNLGYTNIKLGNSDSTVTATTVTFSGTLNSGVVSEITQKLNSIYQTVTAGTSSTATFDVVIVTGLKKGATPKPSGTPTAAPSASPTASPSPTP